MVSAASRLGWARTASPEAGTAPHLGWARTASPEAGAVARPGWAWTWIPSPRFEAQSQLVNATSRAEIAVEQAQAGPPVVAASAAEVEPEHAMDQQCQPSLPTAQSSGPDLLAFAWTFGAEALEAHPHRAGAPSVDPS